MGTPISTSVHIRLAEEHGKGFERRMVELGYNAMSAGEPGYYYLSKGKSRVLMQQEVSGDYVLRDFVDEPDGELVEILKKTAIKFQGDIEVKGGGTHFKYTDGQEVDVTPKVPELKEDTSAQVDQNGMPVFPNHAPRVNSDQGNPDTYMKMAVNAIGKVMSAFSTGSLDYEEALVEGIRISSALKLYAGINAGLINPLDIEQEIQLTKAKINAAKAHVMQKTANAIPPHLQSTTQENAPMGAAQKFKKFMPFDATSEPVDVLKGANPAFKSMLERAYEQAEPGLVSTAALAGAETTQAEVDTDDLEDFFLKQIGGK